MSPGPQPTEPGQAYPPQAPTGYYQQGGDGPGIQQRAAHAADVVARHVKTPETKEFFKTSEFLVWALTCIGVLIAAAAIGGGDNGNDVFNGDKAWALVTAISPAYILSRGLSKAGTRRGYGDAPMDRGF
jgi:hypothetical protein